MHRRAVQLIGASVLAAAPLLAAIGGTAPAAPAAASAAATTTGPVEVRVNQVAYPDYGDKVAFAMLPARVSGVAFTVQCRACGVLLTGTSDDYVGSWNSRYHAVYKLDFSRLTVPGTYRITVQRRRPVGAVAGVHRRRDRLAVRQARH